MNKELIKNVVAVLAGATGGAVASYFVTRKVVSAKYETILDVEIADVKFQYAKAAEKRDMASKTGDYETPEKAARAIFIRKLIDQGYSPEDAAQIMVNDEPLAPGEEDDDELEAPSDIFDPEVPYVIEEEDFAETHLEYDKNTLTYYMGDETLADPSDGAIDDPESLVGPNSLDLLDAVDTIYVRNVSSGVDFEIVRHQGSFAEVVHGIHNTAAPRRKPRHPQNEE
jgi:hypothetical protein